MTEIVRETVTTNENSKAVPVGAEVSGTQTVERLIYFLFGILEITLIFRLIFKLAGASSGSGFVRLVYGIAGIFIIPFEGIFRRGFAQGVETTSVLEPSTIVAIIVYAVLAWGIVKLVRISSREKQQVD